MVIITCQDKMEMETRKSMKVGDKVYFIGTKSRGDTWQEFITNPHFAPRAKEDIYGIVYTLQGKEIWVFVYDSKSNELLDKSTWGFLEEDLKIK